MPAGEPAARGVDTVALEARTELDGGAAGWPGRVSIRRYRCPAPPGLAALPVQPDGYVAWVGDGGDLGLADALSMWFGPPGG